MRGVSYAGDIALDDITMPTGPCGGLQPTSTTLQNCGFESASDQYCGYTQAQDDNFDWRRDQGGTSSANTGLYFAQLPE